MEEPIRTSLASTLRDLVLTRNVVVVTGHKGHGQHGTLRSALECIPGWTPLFSDGDWSLNGYLAGFHELIDRTFTFCSESYPSLIVTYQQSLKRLFPLKTSPLFTVPKDLTNTSTKEERTRFYHHEYQNKLLFGLAEFLLAALRMQPTRTILVVDRASSMSATAKSLIDILLRLSDSAAAVKFVLIDPDETLFFEQAAEFRFPRCTEHEITALLKLEGRYPAETMRSIYRASRGSIPLARAIVDCESAGLPVVGYIDPYTMIDLFLSAKTTEERKAMAVSYIDGDCRSDDMIIVRNYESSAAIDTDREHLRRHAECMTAYFSGNAPLVTMHAHAVRDPSVRAEALVEASEVLKCIGLYDTWFSYFGRMFADSALRAQGSGDDGINASFINAAFVLYSLGCSKASAPYLDEFYGRFPNSKYIPTVLYAQSMTYGRYQIPVNLPLAETYAVRNLETIDASFRHYDKYHYIKVFAENAYAYIKAKQGKYEEALRLCTIGNQKMLDVYGDSRFKLHQSILIYNTSQVYEIVRKYELAEHQLKLAISYDPFYGEYYNDLGNLLCKMSGRNEDAFIAFDRAIELCPPYYEAHLNRGALYMRIGQHERALADFRRALDIKPTEYRALFEIGTLELQRGEYRSALAAYSASERLAPDNADLQSNMGVACSELGMSADSIDRYRRAIALDSNHALSHNNLAIELFEVGRRDEALYHACIAADLGGDPDYAIHRDYIRNHGQMA